MLIFSVIRVELLGRLNDITLNQLNSYFADIICNIIKLKRGRTLQIFSKNYCNVCNVIVMNIRFLEFFSFVPASRETGPGFKQCFLIQTFIALLTE